MLRINLLPTSLGEGKRRNWAIWGALALLLAALAGGLGYHFLVLTPEVTRREAEAEDMATKRAAVDQLEADAKAIRASVGPIKDKVDFADAIFFQNGIRQKIFRNAAKYTIRDAEYGSMAINGNTLQVGGFVRKMSDLGRLYITMFGNPDVTAVSIQGAQSWPQDAPPVAGVPVGIGQNPATAGWFPVQMTATLVGSVVSPGLPASAAAGGVGGGGGAAGGRGGAGGAGGFRGGPPGGGFGPPGGGGYGGPAGGGAPAAAAGGGAPAAAGPRGGRGAED